MILRVIVRPPDFRRSHISHAQVQAAGTELSAPQRQVLGASGARAQSFYQALSPGCPQCISVTAGAELSALQREVLGAAAAELSLSPIP